MHTWIQQLELPPTQYKYPNLKISFELSNGDNLLWMG